MTDELKKKIMEQINHSGFPLELELIEKLRSTDSLVFPNVSFQTIEGSIKELDIVSIIQSESSDWVMGPVGVSLIIECKKTSKYPWIFFEQVYDPLHCFGLLSKADYSTDFYDEKGILNPLTGCMNTILASHHYNDNSIPKARTYFELGKNDNENSTIFKAVMNIFHGRFFLNHWFVSTGKGDKSKGRTNLNQYAIVIEGELILAKKDGNDFSVDKANHIILIAIDTIANPTGELTGNEIFIDIISKEYFDKYHMILKKEAKDLCRHLSIIYESGLIKPQQARFP